MQFITGYIYMGTDIGDLYLAWHKATKKVKKAHKKEEKCLQRLYNLRPPSSAFLRKATASDILPNAIIWQNCDDGLQLQIINEVYHSGGLFNAYDDVRDGCLYGLDGAYIQVG